MVKKELVLDLLKENSVGFTSAELRTRLHARSLRLAEYEVLKELRTLHSEGMVRLERGRWITTVHKIANSSPSIKIQSSFSNTTTPSTQLPFSEMTTTWSPSKSRILNILQAFVWVHIKFSTVKQDSSSIVVKVSEPSRGRFYLLYFAINPFCYRIGYSMF